MILNKIFNIYSAGESQPPFLVDNRGDILIATGQLWLQVYRQHEISVDQMSTGESVGICDIQKSDLLYRHKYLTRGMFTNLYRTTSLSQLGDILPYRPNQFHTHYPACPVHPPHSLSWSPPLVQFPSISIQCKWGRGRIDRPGQLFSSHRGSRYVYAGIVKTIEIISKCTGPTNRSTWLSVLAWSLLVDNIGSIKQLWNRFIMNL